MKSELEKAMETPYASITEMLSAPTDSRWIQTASGRPFWPLTPRAEDICIEDIAHALSMKCRYSGHTKEFYSVAQHSVLMSHIVPPEDARWALLHDASEAYLPDVARPVKKQMPGFNEIEDRVLRAVAKKFGLAWPMPASIKHADIVMLATEMRDLMAKPPYPWSSIDGIPPLPDQIITWSTGYTKVRFLRRYAELFRAAPASGREGAE